MSTLITIHQIDMDDVRHLLARRERLNRIRDLLSVDEIDTGEVLTNEIDRLDIEALTVQTVVAPIQEAKLAAYMSGLPAMAVIAS